MAKQTPEGRVKDAIKKHLKTHYPDNFHFLPVSNGMGRHGIPDFVCSIPTVITADMVGHTIGVFVGIEAKTLKGKVSPLQTQCLDDIAKSHGAALVVWGSDHVENIDNYIDSAVWRAPFVEKPL
tara:strand:- start:42918 stop:43289 length:372 start_codon:yes stop_codon:yes gene_type:complete